MRVFGKPFEGSSRRACPELAEGFHNAPSHQIPIKAKDAGWITYIISGLSKPDKSCNLRSLTPARDLQRLFEILASPGEPLSPDRLERKTQLTERMKDGTLESICQVVRDLASYIQTKRMNENDTSTWKRARSFLLDEWSAALSVPVRRAERELMELLKGNWIAAQ
ncbi:MAG TPA: hypothetical protein VE136_07710 [Anaerolineales bacterium]|jgi:hypothetical protein|nr:hypothetical protein [Anaerolineales bacterium]